MYCSRARFANFRSTSANSLFYSAERKILFTLFSHFSQKNLIYQQNIVKIYRIHDHNINIDGIDVRPDLKMEAFFGET